MTMTMAKQNTTPRDAPAWADKALTFLSDDKGHSAIDIVRHLASHQFTLERSEVNRWLYLQAQQGVTKQIPGTPPTWFLARSPEQKSEVKLLQASKTIVVLDLGNIHDALKPLESYLDTRKDLEIMAYADKAYNGYGVSPPANAKVYFWHNPGMMRESTDVKLISDVAIRLHNSGSCHVIVATLDKVVAALKPIIEENSEKTGHKCTVVGRWEELKLHIE